MRINPIEIKKLNEFLLFAKWQDGYEATIKLEDLRKNCPCAECTGEAARDKIYSLPKPIQFEPGVFDLEDLKTVGNYAVAARWKNGHDTGIYTWDKFKEIFDKHRLIQDEIDKVNQEKKKDKRNINFNVIN